MFIYIASPLSNCNLNLRIERILVELGHNCFLPQRDAGNASGNPPDQIATRNWTAIREVDCVLVVGKGLGNDTSWEVGYARGLSKKCILLGEATDLSVLGRSIMPRFSVDETVVVASLADDNSLKKILRDSIDRPAPSSHDA